MRGSVVRLTIGDYLYRVSGFLENVNISIDNTNTSWEIMLNPKETDVAQLPHVVTVQCNFKPIMDFLPRRETYDQPYVPLIANGSKYSNTAIDAPNASSTNRAAALVAQEAAAQQAIAQGTAAAAVANYRSQNPLSANNILGGQYATTITQAAGTPNNGYPAPKKASNAIIQNTVNYSTGVPTLNPYGYVGGANGTKKRLNYGTYY